MVGMWGQLRFRVSDSYVLTFSGMKRTVSASWNENERVGLKSLPQFGGPALQELSMDIALDAGLGVKPYRLLKLIETQVESGSAYPIVLGKRLIGQNKWVCVKSSEAIEIVLKRGEIYRATVTLNFKEYI